MKRAAYIVRQAAYTVFSFAYFLVASAELTLRGFALLTLRRATADNKRRYRRILQRRARFIVSNIPGTTFTYNNDVEESFSSPSVIICNHQSHLDIMAVMMLTPDMIILTKGWVWHNPFYGAIIRYAGYLPVGDSEQLLNEVEERVRQGCSVMVFPEGTRSEDCRIQRFHRGAFYLAERLRLDIVPVFIDGFGRVLPKTSYHLHPGRLSVEVMPRMKSESYAAEGGYRGVARKAHDLYMAKNEEVRNNR